MFFVHSVSKIYRVHVCDEGFFFCLLPHLEVLIQYFFLLSYIRSL